MATFGMTVFFIGVCMADSASITIPAAIMFAGLAIAYIGVRHEKI